MADLSPELQNKLNELERELEVGICLLLATPSSPRWLPALFDVNCAASKGTTLWLVVNLIANELFSV
jgi:hypothetical protein